MEDWGYYTVTCDYSATGEGMCNMILIGLYGSKLDALEAFKNKFGTWYADGAEVTKGLDIDAKHLFLLTDYAKKQIVKLRAKDPNGPGAFSYINQVHVNYS